MTRRDRRRFMISMAASVVVAAVLSVGAWLGFFARFEVLSRDILFQTWTPDPSPEGLGGKASTVVIVAIDDASIGALGRLLTWPRRHYAQVVDRIAAGHARVIAFDIGFVEPNEDDALLAAAMKRFVDVDPDELRRAGAPIRKRSVLSPVVGTPNVKVVRVPGSPLAYETPLLPQSVIQEASTALGHANVIPDSIDGSVRRTPLVVRIGDREYRSLSLVAAEAFTSTGGRGYVLDADAPGVVALNRFIPTNSSFEMMISFLGPPSRVSDPRSQTFKVVSFIDVLNGQVDPTIFRDRMVLIGALDATGLADDYQVPTSRGRGKMAGVELHAQAFTTLITPHFFAEQQLPVTIAFIWLFSLLTGVTAFRLNIVPGAAAVLAVAIAYELGAFAYAATYYDPTGVAIPNLFYPPLANVLTLGVVSIYRVVFEGAERRATRGAMGKYLSPAILNEVLKDPDRLRLGGEKRVMTVLFTDIRGFTSISEKLDPEELVQLLNEYLTVMTDIVHRHEGVLDKYMGDAIMAWWGAPTDQPDHAYRACMTALEMRAALHRLHAGWAARNVPTLEMGVGINTGPMVYGNTGSQERFDFTVLGDAVNLASRLEGANKEYGSNIIISASTRDEVIDRDFVMRYLDVIEVKGKTEPVEIYELLGVAGQVEPDVPELLDAWATAIALYRARDFGLAEEAFRRVLTIRPNDGPARVYVDRCIDLRANPPAPDWDGVFVMTHK